MCALAVLAIAAARPLPPAPLAQPPGSTGAQPAAWSDTGLVPASPDEPPPKAGSGPHSHDQQATLERWLEADPDR
jgi:hypothetical protein